MSNDFRTEPIEFARQWSAIAGELAGIKTAINAAEKRAGEAYIRGQDQVASALRDLATQLNRDAHDLSKMLEGFINEDRKRSHEQRKLVGG